MSRAGTLETYSSRRLMAFDPPPSWELKPLGFLFDSVGGSTPSKENASYWEGSIPWISPKDMKSSVIYDSEDHITPLALKETRLPLIPPSVVLVVVRGMILAHTIPVAMTATEATINQDMKALYARKGLLPTYLAHLLRAISPVLFSTIEESGHGTRCLRLDLWRNILVGVPPEEVQSAIVRFVDCKTAQIDALIAKKQRQIDLLGEKRQALIGQAVTKGLDPAAALKATGLPGLGAMPVHWTKSKVKYLISFVTSGSRGWAEHYSDDGDLFIQSGNLGTQLELDFQRVQRVTPPSGAEIVRTLVSKDDVLVCVTGAYTGNVAHVAEEIERAFVNQHVALLRPDRALVAPRFLAYLLHSPLAQTQLLMNQYGGTKQGLGLDDIREIMTFVPPLVEQVRISRFLDERSRLFEKAISLLRRQIDRLGEYRQTLISAAVTGRIEVSAVETTPGVVP